MVASRSVVSRRWMISALMSVLLASLVGTAQPAEAYTRMVITDANLTRLQGFPASAWGTSNKLKHEHGVTLNAFERTEYNIGGYYRIGNPSNGNAWCVDAVKSLSNQWTIPWRQGAKVVDGGLPAGTVIATFNSSGSYNNGHAAILKKYTKDALGNITGFEVWDQNWASPADYMFRKHTFSRSGSGTSDADSYYVVKY